LWVTESIFRRRSRNPLPGHRSPASIRLLREGLPVTLLPRLSGKNAGKRRIKVEHRREVGAHASSQLADSPRKNFAELQALGMVSLIGSSSAIIHSPNPKEMQEAYQVRAALEEIAGRTAAPTVKGKTTVLQNELNAMRAAVRDGNLDAHAEHDARFHRGILAASGNDLLLRVSETLGFDLRIRAAIGKVSKAMPEVVESHQSIVDALEKGRGREAGLLLRNHVETFLEYLRKSESDSGVHRAFRQDLEGAKDVFPSGEFVDSVPIVRDFLSTCSRDRWRLLRLSSVAGGAMGHRDRRCLG